MACGLAVVCTCQIDVASAAAGAARRARAAEVTARSVLASGIRFEFTRPPGRSTFGYEYGRGLQRAIRELSKQRLRTYGHPRIGAITFTAPGRRGLVSSSRRTIVELFRCTPKESTTFSNPPVPADLRHFHVCQESRTIQCGRICEPSSMSER